MRDGRLRRYQEHRRTAAGQPADVERGRAQRRGGVRYLSHRPGERTQLQPGRRLYAKPDGPGSKGQRAECARRDRTDRRRSRYCIDAMLEHAVMHPIRHAFQLDELIKDR